MKQLLLQQKASHERKVSALEKKDCSEEEIRSKGIQIFTDEEESEVNQDQLRIKKANDSDLKVLFDSDQSEDKSNAIT